MKDLLLEPQNSNRRNCEFTTKTPRALRNTKINGFALVSLVAWWSRLSRLTCQPSEFSLNHTYENLFVLAPARQDYSLLSLD
jgi:hypothetical protein